MTRVSPTSTALTSGLRVRTRGAFSLIEVVLAIGVLSLAVVAMLGLFAPTMGSVKQVVDGNKASSLVGLVNAEVNQNVSYNDIGTELRADRKLYFYAWERQNDDDVVEIVISEFGTDEPGDTTDSAGNTIANPTDDLANIVGPVFVVTMEQLELVNNDYPYADYDDEAYIPFLVTIYQADLDVISTGGFNGLTLDETTRVLSYPSAKLR